MRAGLGGCGQDFPTSVLLTTGAGWDRPVLCRVLGGISGLHRPDANSIL